MRRVSADAGPSMSALAVMDTTPAELADALDKLLTEIVAYRLRPRIRSGPPALKLVTVADLAAQPIRTCRAGAFNAIARDPFEGAFLLAVREIGAALFDIGGDDMMHATGDEVCARDPSNEGRRSGIINGRWDGIGDWHA